MSATAATPLLRYPLSNSCKLTEHLCTNPNLYGLEQRRISVSILLSEWNVNHAHWEYLQTLMASLIKSGLIVLLFVQLLNGYHFSLASRAWFFYSSRSWLAETRPEDVTVVDWLGAVMSRVGESRAITFWDVAVGAIEMVILKSLTACNQQITIQSGASFGLKRGGVHRRQKYQTTMLLSTTFVGKITNLVSFEVNLHLTYQFEINFDFHR